jgi:hypothetical protein
MMMPYRQTFVIEYPSANHAPPVGPNMEMLGGKLIAVQFDDALEEIEALQECMDIDNLLRAQKLRHKMKAGR